SARQICSRAPRSAENVRVVPTGVDTRYFAPAANKAAARVELGIGADEPLVLGVGRLAGVKQFDRLITAFSVACARGLVAKLDNDHAHTLADALPIWLGDRQRLASLGQRARDLAVERYDWERVVDGLEAVCSQVVAEWR